MCAIRQKATAKPFVDQVCHLLLRGHEPWVRTGRSRIAATGNAGNGVFAKRTIIAGTVTCLYPGVHSGGFPKLVIPINTQDENVVFLGDQTTPSGIPVEDNAYIMNLGVPVGGYIDGCALVDELSNDRRRLDENYSACGHLINHSANRANVRVVSFAWADVPVSLTAQPPSGSWYGLCNIPRRDGTPRYVDERGETHCYPNTRPTLQEIRQMGGAAMVVIYDIQRDAELLLDYGLPRAPPLPRWAQGWYSRNS